MILAFCYFSYDDIAKNQHYIDNEHKFNDRMHTWSKHEERD